MELSIGFLFFSSLLGFLYSINLFVNWFKERLIFEKLMFALYVFFLSMIVLDVWESMKYIDKTVWVMDAYGFIGPSFYFFVLLTLGLKKTLKRKEYLWFLPGILELLVQLIKIFDYEMFSAFLISDYNYMIVLESLEVLSFMIAVYLAFYKLPKLLWNKISLLNWRVGTFIFFNLIIVVLWGVLLMSEIALLSFMGNTIALLIALMVVVLVSNKIQTPFEVRTLALTKQRKVAINEDPNASNNLRKITEIMEVEQFFKDPEINVKQLSNKVNLPKDLVSALINHKLKKSFRQYVNGLRIIEATKLLSNSKYDHLSMLGIAFEVGFKSESTFYNAFRKVYNTTPKAYKQNLSKDQ